MSGVSAAEIFWWVALPYFALGVFVVGHIWRWRYDQFGWTSRSTQLQERRMLKWGAPIFHYATFAAIAGHVLGILIPAQLHRVRSASPTTSTTSSPPSPGRSRRPGDRRRDHPRGAPAAGPAGAGHHLARSTGSR